VRRYDASHLAQHPEQKVSAMKLLLSAEVPEEEKTLNYSFRLGVKYRHRPGNFDSSGFCSTASAAPKMSPSRSWSTARHCGRFIRLRQIPIFPDISASFSHADLELAALPQHHEVAECQPERFAARRRRRRNKAAWSASPSCNRMAISICGPEFGTYCRHNIMLGSP
jgi:hypothetical protein